MQDQRYSRQRERIYRAVRDTDLHPTAQTVYAWLRPELPHLSLGTVYRNLHQLAQEGRLRELPGPEARFDAAVAPHTHVCCLVCGAVRDLPMPYDSGLDGRAGQSGWLVEDHLLTFYGICPACAGHDKEKTADAGAQPADNLERSKSSWN